MFLNPSNTVYDAKRLVGRKFSDQDVQDDIANMNWPFTIRKGSADRPTIRGEASLLISELNASHMAQHRKFCLEGYLGKQNAIIKRKLC